MQYFFQIFNIFVYIHNNFAYYASRFYCYIYIVNNMINFLYLSIDIALNWFYNVDELIISHYLSLKESDYDEKHLEMHRMVCLRAGGSPHAIRMFRIWGGAPGNLECRAVQWRRRESYRELRLLVPVLRPDAYLSGFALDRADEARQQAPVSFHSLGHDGLDHCAVRMYAIVGGYIDAAAVHHHAVPPSFRKREIKL